MYWYLYISQKYGRPHDGEDQIYHPDDIDMIYPLLVIARESSCCVTCAANHIIQNNNNGLTSSEHQERLSNYYGYSHEGSFEALWEDVALNHGCDMGVEEEPPKEYLGNRIRISYAVSYITMPNGAVGMNCKECTQFYQYAEPNSGSDFLCKSCKSYERMIIG